MYNSSCSFLTCPEYPSIRSSAYKTTVPKRAPTAAKARPISSEILPAPDVVVAAATAAVVVVGSASLDVPLTRRPADSQNWATFDAVSVCG